MTAADIVILGGSADICPPSVSQVVLITVEKDAPMGTYTVIRRRGTSSQGWRIAPTLILLLSIPLLATFTGCRERGKDGGPEEVTVLCGSSFFAPGEELTKQFTAETGIAVAMTSAGSEDFLPLVKAGKKGDILITHDPYLDYVRGVGALADSVQVGVIAPVLVVQPGNPKKIAGINDLARPGLRVALSNPEYSTCGEMVFKLLAAKGLKDAVLRNVENRLTKGHGTLGTLVKTDAVDVVIMWNGVAHTFGDSVQIIPTSYEYDTEVCVHVIGLGYSGHSEAMRRFLEFCRSKGPEIFARHGYTKDGR
jgi:molybdate transport system substrate-binding protein